ncbi:hypothetical protein AWR27_21685 [Spirosoma montaniterrae]|uniref:Methyltransferase type 11 n=1 Tax=Spirosoma montaniterrae TaxID=1178516 RepID=A0A1P9X267_9BACT|nr:hypothetical protein AWR27_21685 [Spirosoma montaniterrae]
MQYYQCSRCDFIYTETPYWLAEAYDSVITRLDVGLVYRNEQMAGLTQAVITTWFDKYAQFIDYGGGYGLLVRMMRDRGYDFYRQDAFCANLFAESFDITEVAPFRAELLTAFEVLEHLPDPVAEIEKMLALSDTILLSTIVQPAPTVTPNSWWYFIPDTGQHVSIYSKRSLQLLAERFNLRYYGGMQDVHLLSRKPITHSLFRFITRPRITRLVNQFIPQPSSRLLADFNQIARQLPNQQPQ